MGATGVQATDVFTCMFKPGKFKQCVKNASYPLKQPISNPTEDKKPTEAATDPAVSYPPTAPAVSDPPTATCLAMAAIFGSPGTYTDTYNSCLGKPTQSSKPDPTDIPLGTGMAEDAKKAIQNRGSQIGGY